MHTTKWHIPQDEQLMFYRPRCCVDNEQPRCDYVCVSRGVESSRILDVPNVGPCSQPLHVITRRTHTAHINPNPDYQCTSSASFFPPSLYNHFHFASLCAHEGSVFQKVNNRNTFHTQDEGREVIKLTAPSCSRRSIPMFTLCSVEVHRLSHDSLPSRFFPTQSAELHAAVSIKSPECDEGIFTVSQW